LALDAVGISVTDVTFKAASGGGRETGLGQQPNWFAMHLMFIIHTAFGMALVERRRWVRIGLVIAGFFIFVMMLKSGSRGGAYATLIGGVLAALAHPLFRKWFVRFLAISAVIFLVGIVFDVGDTAKALKRITSTMVLGQNYRQLNWLTCIQMFQDSWGLGIGAGGYEDLLPEYNNYVAQSLYTYPHGIVWELMAHYGVVGLGLLGWLLASITGMARELIAWTKGTEAEVFAWTMPAAMLGYFAWSFVEFTLTEKPFWEFLALYTALYLIVGRMKKEGETLSTFSLEQAVGREK
jgi:O-antigen ligase